MSRQFGHPMLIAFLLHVPPQASERHTLGASKQRKRDLLWDESPAIGHSWLRNCVESNTVSLSHTTFSCARKLKLMASKSTVYKVDGHMTWGDNHEKAPACHKFYFWLDPMIHQQKSLMLQDLPTVSSFQNPFQPWENLISSVAGLLGQEAAVGTGKDWSCPFYTPLKEEQGEGNFTLLPHPAAASQIWLLIYAGRLTQEINCVGIHGVL